MIKPKNDPLGDGDLTGAVGDIDKPEETSNKKSSKKEEPAPVSTVDPVLPEPEDIPEGELSVSDAIAPAAFGGTFTDEFAGQGGAYVVDGKTGERKRV